jgi:hypothetical protein
VKAVAANASYPPLLAHMLAGKEFLPLLRTSESEVARHRSAWRELVRALITMPPLDAEMAARFHAKWHVCHHYVRELVDDDRLLLDMLWVWLPRYQGPTQLLYRGENIARLAGGRVGFGWSDEEKTARMFASGLNSVQGGGVVLQTLAPAEAIIAGPSDHSIWLQESEFTLDTRRLGEIVQIQTFPPCD